MPTNNVSVFESPLVTVNFVRLLELWDPFTCYPWNSSVDQLPISRAEIEACLLSDGHIMPGIYSDDEDDIQRLSNWDCSRPDHIRRICWLIRNWSDNEYTKDPISLSIPISLREDPVSFCIVNGYHRFLAATCLNKNTILVQIKDGSLSSVEKILCPDKWWTTPQNDVFGSNLITTKDEAWEYTCNDEKTMAWVNNVYGGCVLQLKMIGAIKSAIITNDKTEERCLLRDNELTFESLIDSLSRIISPVFSMDKISIFFRPFFCGQ